jgi:hypothetical protein
MRIATIIAAAGLLGIGAASASAGTSTLVFPLTNDTGDAWGDVTFELRLPRGVTVSPEAFAALQFVLDINRHTSTKNPYDLSLDAQTHKVLKFDYSAYAPITAGDGSVSFSLTINNPENIPFRVHVAKGIVPAPGAGMAFLGAAGFAAFRRRRVA